MTISGHRRTVIHRVPGDYRKTREMDRLLELVAGGLAQARDEEAALRNCRLIDVGLVQRVDFTELRYYLWCSDEKSSSISTRTSQGDRLRGSGVLDTSWMREVGDGARCHFLTMKHWIPAVN